MSISMFPLKLRWTRGQKKTAKVTIKPKKYFKHFDSETKRILEEKRKVLRCVVDKMPFLRDIEHFRTEIFACRKDTLWAYKLAEAHKQNLTELWSLEKKLKTGNLNNTKNRSCVINVKS